MAFVDETNTWERKLTRAMEVATRTLDPSSLCEELKRRFEQTPFQRGTIRLFRNFHNRRVVAVEAISDGYAVSYPNEDPLRCGTIDEAVEAVAALMIRRKVPDVRAEASSSAGHR